MITKKLKKTKKNNKSRSIYKHTSINKSKNKSINKSINISSNTSKYGSKNLNNKIITILTIVKNYYEEQNDRIHINAYERAIYQIKHWNKPITKGNELSDLIGIGKGMIEKIDTIIETGTLPIIKEKGLEKRLEKGLEKGNGEAIHSNLDNIHILGFGKIFIKELKNKYNARTINDIRKLVVSGKVKLNNTQSLGLKYYEDLQIPIPRTEITMLGNKIKDIVEKENMFLRCFIAGSYPSGTKATSKDIDILIVVNDDVGRVDRYGSIESNYIKKNIINNIQKHIPLETISIGNTKFLGLIKSPYGGNGNGNDNGNGNSNYNNNNNKWRHLDIRVVNYEEMPYTWLYYTGGKVFNKLIRERLHNKGYKLNEYGIYKVENGKDTQIIFNDSNGKDIEYGSLDNHGKIIISDKEMMDYTTQIEKKIFKIADLEYKSVKDRY